MEQTAKGEALPREHFISPYLQNPVHPVTVTVVGAGGNGSHMLSALARINSALVALGHPGLHVTVWDPDTVEAPNLGRQLFTEGDLGTNKAVALATRFNRFYGTGWDSENKFFTRNSPCGNILVTCTDSASSRIEAGLAFAAKPDRTGEEFDHLYWMDLGNAQRTGQVILGSAQIKQPKTDMYRTAARLPLPSEVFDYASVRDGDSGPSCSLAEAIEKQDLFVNAALVNLAGSLLWSLFREMAIDCRGFFMNLETFKVNPVAV